MNRSIQRPFDDGSVRSSGRLDAVSGQLATRRPLVSVRRALSAQCTGYVCVNIDVSNSMLGEKLRGASAALASLAGELAASRALHMGLVTFHGSAAVHCPMQPAQNVATSFAGLCDSDIGPGGTNITAGIDLSATILSQVPVGAFKVLITMSDGEHNAASDPLAAADRVKAADVTHVCIAFGGPGEVDYSTLKRLASGPSFFQSAADNQALRDLFRRCGTTISKTVPQGINPHAGLGTL